MLKIQDFIKADYTLTIKETEELFETTKAEDAKKYNKFEENRKYEPELIVLGGGWVPKGLEDELVQMDVGSEKVIEIPPEKAFGQRDISKIRTIPIRKFKDVKGLAVGAKVDVNGRIGTIKSIGAGRVVTDFNPPLSGRTLVYNIKIIEKIENKHDIILELTKKRMPFAKSESIEVNVTDNKAIIKIPEEAFLVEGLQFAKKAISNDITTYTDDINEVIFEEILKIKRPETESVKEPIKQTVVEQTSSKPEEQPETIPSQEKQDQGVQS